MKQNFSYKNIHIGAIATFYIIALLVRLVSLCHSILGGGTDCEMRIEVDR